MTTRLAWRLTCGCLTLLGVGWGVEQLVWKLGLNAAILRCVHSAWWMNDLEQRQRLTDCVHVILIAPLSAFPAFLSSGILILKVGGNRIPWRRMLTYSAGASFLYSSVSMGLWKLFPNAPTVAHCVNLFCLTFAWCAFWALRSLSGTTPSEPPAP